MSKSYELFLHYKQGDDFGHLVSQYKTLPGALGAWAAIFKDHVATCERLAKAFEGRNIDVNADTHLIQFVPGDDAAVKCLETMVAEELISVVEFDDEDDDEDDEDLNDDVEDDEKFVED